MRELSFHFLFFIKRIRNIKPKDKFVPKNYFHKKFLNKNGEIAPKGRFNKALDRSFKDFFNSYKARPQDQKDEFYKLIIFSNNIHLYFENHLITDVIKLKNDNIKKIIGDDSFSQLMKELWSYLSNSNNSWEIDEHYKEFYKKLPPSKMCPFCGLDKLSNPDLYRADYDHIAYKYVYPISTITLKNLAPSCPDCNQKFKKTKDVFFDNLNQRCIFLYPYKSSQKIEIDLSGSVIPNTEIMNTSGNWVINIIPENDFSKTWDIIYDIKVRYKDAIQHDKWTRQLIKNLSINNIHLNSSIEVQEYLNKYKEMYNPNELEVGYHIKYAYYNYLATSNNNIYYSQILKLIA